MSDALDPQNVYIGVIERLEPGLTAIDQDPALASIAISLKRIADTFERANFNGDVLANSIEGAIYRGLQGGRRT